MKQQGYTLAAALVLIAILSIFMALSVPIWTRIKQRENEEELIFRGKEYVEAIARYHARFHIFPPDMDTLYKQKFIRKLYKDPMTESGKWKVLHPESLVEAGAAGQINQPGQHLNPNESGDQDKDAQGKQSKSGFGNDRDQNKNQNAESSDDASKDENDKALEDPETESTGAVVGVVSRSRKASIKIYNNQTRYNKWVFVFTPLQQEQQGQQPPGKPGKPPKGGPKDQKPPGRNQPNQPQNNQENHP